MSVAIIKQDASGAIVGWVIAGDLQDARRQAQMAWDHEFAQVLYRMEFDPPPGKYAIPVNGDNYTLLVS